MTIAFCEGALRNGHVTRITVVRPALLGEGDFAVFVGDQTAHDPQPEAAPNSGPFFEAPEEVFGAILRQSWPLIADINDQRIVRGARLQANDAARRRCGARVDQQIECGLANAFAGDRKRSSYFVDPGKPNALARRLRLNEQAQVIEVDRPCRMLRVPAPVVDEIRTDDVANVSQPALEQAQRGLAHAHVVAMSAQRVERVEEAS